MKITTKNAPMYSNTSPESVKASQVYQNAMPWLKRVKRKYDPDNVMGQAGGFKIRP